MNRPGFGSTHSETRHAQGEAYYSAVLRNSRQWAPEWAGHKPGQHPMLPAKPPMVRR